MKLYALRVSLTTVDQDLFTQLNVSKNIEQFEQALSDADKQLELVDLINGNEPKYSVKICVPIDQQGVMAGIVSKANTLHGYDREFKGFDVDNYPPVIWFWDREEQVLLVNKVTKVFPTASSACKCFSNLVNTFTLAELGLRAEIEPVLDDVKHEFWREYDSFESIEKVEFELIPPNLFGETEKSMRDALNDVTKQTNASSIKTVFENVGGKLKLDSNGWVGNAVRWIKKGGGNWKMWGRKHTSRSKTDTSSYKSAKLIILEGEISEIELQGYDSKELAHLISHYQNEYTYKENQR